MDLFFFLVIQTQVLLIVFWIARFTARQQNIIPAVNPFDNEYEATVRRRRAIREQLLGRHDR